MLARLTRLPPRKGLSWRDIRENSEIHHVVVIRKSPGGPI
jgi:hypothetical protein